MWYTFSWIYRLLSMPKYWPKRPKPINYHKKQMETLDFHLFFIILQTITSCFGKQTFAQNIEIRTIAKSLPLLGWNTHKPLILSHSADFSRIFGKNTTQRCGDFFENRRLDLLFPKPAAIPLHLHDNGWCQKERPCGGKKIRAANENRNFTEVFGLCDKKWNCELWL